jgi:hypothetical protein
MRRTVNLEKQCGSRSLALVVMIGPLTRTRLWSISLVRHSPRCNVTGMKYPTTRFKNLKVALSEIAEFIRSGEQLQTGKPLRQFGGLRPRELVANWLLCVAFNHEHRSPERLTFISDPLDGDGILYDTETEATYPTEHVLVPDAHDKTVDVEALILKAINDKRNKGGAAYARGKTLVVFLNAGGGGRWVPNGLARRLPDPLHFAVVWVVGLHHIEAGEYTYGVSSLDVSEGDAPTFLIRIGSDFDSWETTRIQ